VGDEVYRFQLTRTFDTQPCWTLPQTAGTSGSVAPVLGSAQEVRSLTWEADRWPSYCSPQLSTSESP
jgi:hypothetical protein